MAGTGRHAVLVAAGILLSRISGLIRQRIFSRYFGLSDSADAFTQAFRIPNFLQNLFGEGVLSASFIPVYSRLLTDVDDAEAGRVAGVIGALLAIVTSVLVLVGVLATPFLIDAIAPGFTGPKRELTIRLVRILFPGTGLLVLSAWCLGILNSHRRFFLSYAAPVIYNAAMVAVMLAYRYQDQEQLAIKLAWGSVAGSVLMLGVQLPAAAVLARRLRAKFTQNAGEVLRNFVPVFFSRGVVQISAYVDSIFASLLGQGAVAALANAQTVSMLPVSLFGMAVSAAELPAMSSGDPGDLRQRLDSGLLRIAVLVVPSAMAFAALGDVIVAVLFQNGEFTYGNTLYVWRILAGSAVGLLASTLGRLYSSTYYALRDTRTPLRFAIVRIVIATALAWLFAFPLGWGVPGLTVAAGIAAWIEFSLLRRSLNRRIGPTGIRSALMGKLWLAAALAAGAAWGVKLGIGLSRPVFFGGAILGVYGAVYFSALQVLERRLNLLPRLWRRRR